MIKYIKTINHERKQFSKRRRTLLDSLTVFAVIVGYFTIIEIYNNCFWKEACKVLNESEFLFWIIFPIVFLIGMFVGQLIVFGIFSLALLAQGKITSKEALKFTIFLRAPKNLWS